MPYSAWWTIWLVIAIGAIPAVVVAIRAKRSGAVLVISLTPLLAAILLVTLAQQCANLSSLGGSSGSACPDNAEILGWGVVIVGLAALVASVTWVAWRGPVGSDRLYCEDCFVLVVDRNLADHRGHQFRGKSAIRS